MRNILLTVALVLSSFPSLGWATENPPIGEQRLDRTNLLIYRDRTGAIRPVRSVADWQQRRAVILEGMQRVMGNLPGAERRCALDVQVERETDCGTYLRRSITYAAEPGSRVPAFLLIPKAALSSKKRFPAVLALHPTHRLGYKTVVGLGESPNDEYGVELVRLGFVVLVPPYPLLAEYHPDLKGLGYVSGMMKAVWNNIRGLDLLASLPYVSSKGFGAIGHSLGGHTAIFSAAFDERIRVVVSSCGLDSFQDYGNGDIRGWTSERYMPRLYHYSYREVPFDFHEVSATLAPRFCLLSAPLGDTNFQWWSVDGVAAAAAQIYHLMGVPQNLRVVHPDCGHLFPPEQRQEAYRLFQKHLR